jgi:hypothetical protein
MVDDIEYQVSAYVALTALAMLAASGCVSRKSLKSRYRVTWDPAAAQDRTAPASTYVEGVAPLVIEGHP